MRVVLLITYYLTTLTGISAFHHVGTESKAFLAVASVLNRVGLGREIVQQVHDHRLLSARLHWGTVFQLTVVGKHHMHNHVDFVVVNSFLFQCFLETVGRGKEGGEEGRTERR